MSLDKCDYDMFKKRLKGIEEHLSDISYSMTPGLPLAKKLMGLIQNGTPKWQCTADQRVLTVNVGDYTITLSINTTTGVSTEVVIGKTCPIPSGYQRLPAIQLPLAIWFMAYDRTMGEAGETTLSDVLDKSFRGNE